MDMRNNKYMVRRGGWKRLCLIFLVVAIIAIALGVGLAVGLRKAHMRSSHSSPSNSSDSGDPFPVGSYSLTTNLDRVSTACTSNSETWVCYPLTTYKSSPVASLAVYNWIISGPISNLTISSSDNPFAISFTNASLTLLDAGTGDERYFFSVAMDKLVVPSSSITNDNHNANCYYNGTMFQAALYTKRTGVNGTSMGNATESIDSSLGWVNWPYAVEVNQTIHGGQDVPNCYKLDNEVPGTRITTGLAAQPTADECACVWRNYNL